MPSGRELGPEDVGRLVREVQGADIILVGGQALNIWADRYAARYPSLIGAGPWTSADIDFFANQAAARRCSVAWGGRIRLPNLDDHGTPNTAQVETPVFDPPLVVDFLGSINGVHARDLRELAAEVSLPDGQRLLVMHQFHCLVGQLANVYGPLTRRNGPDGERHRDRVRLAIRVMRCHVLDLLDGQVRGARNTIEAIAEVAHDRDAIAAWRRDGTDVLDAIPAEDARLGKAFLTKRWPQIKAWVAARR